MARKTYRIRFKAQTEFGFFVNVAKELEGLLRGTKANLTDRRVLGRARSALYKMPEHVVTKDGVHLWSANLEEPIPGPREGVLSYAWQKNAVGEEIISGVVRLDPAWVEKVWELCLKPMLESRETTGDTEAALRAICEDLKLLDAYERLVPSDEEEEGEDGKGDEEETTEKEAPTDAGACPDPCPAS